MDQVLILLFSFNEFFTGYLTGFTGMIRVLIAIENGKYGITYKLIYSPFMGKKDKRLTWQTDIYWWFWPPLGPYFLNRW